MPRAFIDDTTTVECASRRAAATLRFLAVKGVVAPALEGRRIANPALASHYAAGLPVDR